MDIGASETETFWQEIPRKLKYRGLAGVKLVISNAHEGVMAAVSRVFRATWQRAGCTPSEGNPPMASAAASLPGGRLCSGMTWRIFQAVVMDDDALDDELQDGLLVGRP